MELLCAAATPCDDGTGWSTLHWRCPRARGAPFAEELRLQHPDILIDFGKEKKSFPGVRFDGFFSNFRVALLQQGNLSSGCACESSRLCGRP